MLVVFFITEWEVMIMKKERLYTVREAANLVSESLSPRTLYGWILKIEHYTPKVFLRAINEKNPYFVYGEPKEQLLVREKEVEQFQKLLKFRKQGIPLQLAIFQSFLRAEDYQYLQENGLDYQQLKQKVIRDYQNQSSEEI